MRLLNVSDIDDNGFFEKLFYSYRKQMLYLAYSYLHNKEDAEDIVHDVFLFVACRHISLLKSFKDEKEVRNYLLKAIKNKAIDKIRSEKTELVKRECLLYRKLYSDEEFLQKLSLKTDYEEILMAINSLDSVYRDALYYHFVLEMTVKQVADFLGQSISATKQQLVRGKKLLISNLKGE